MHTPEIHFDVSIASVHAHTFKVTCSIELSEGTELLFSMPSWTPGSYLIREFAQHVLKIEAFCGSESLPLLKVNKDTWSCKLKGEKFRIEYEIYAFDSSIRAAFLDDTYAFFTGTSVFMRFHGLENVPHRLTLQKPVETQCTLFQVATSMPSVAVDAHGYGDYLCADYDELVDHPVLMGTQKTVTFKVNQTDHHLVVTPNLEFDIDRLVVDCQRICKSHLDLFGNPAPFPHYFFLLRVEDEGYGGLEHRSSSALLCKIADLPVVGQKKMSDGYRTLLGLISHEYFHAWNVKKLKPAAFTPYNYNSENYTDLLWFFEGFTSYYDDLALVRGQTIEQESYFELLSRTISKVQGGQGRLKQTLTDASFDAWIKFYRPNENSHNSTVSYYSKGSLVALCLDLEIRKESSNQKSLSDVMRALWSKYGVHGLGISQDNIIDETNKIANRDMSSFFASYTHTTQDLPLFELLNAFGVELTWQEKLKSSEVPTPYLGCELSKGAGEGCRILHVSNGSPAMTAGLSAGDVIIAVNDLRVTAANFESRLARYSPESQVTIHAFRRSWLKTFEVQLTKHPKTTCVLKKSASASTEQLAALNSWLGG